MLLALSQYLTSYWYTATIGLHIQRVCEPFVVAWEVVNGDNYMFNFALNPIVGCHVNYARHNFENNSYNFYYLA